MRFGFGLLAVASFMPGVVLTAAPIPKDEQIQIAKCHVNLEGEWTCCSMKSVDSESKLPDVRTGKSFQLVFDDQHLSVLIRNREGKIIGHECCDFELRKVDGRILLDRKNISPHSGGINQYSPNYFIEFHKAQIKLIFYVKNDIRGGYADIAAGKITDDYDEVVWTYKRAAEKR